MLPFSINPGLEDFPVYQPGRPIEEVARELGLPASDIIKLASNENPLGPSPAALAAMRNALENINLYPDGNAFYLRQRLSQKLNIDPAHLILGNGSNEIIEFVGHALLSSDSKDAAHTEPVEVIVSQYCFAVYPLVARLFNANLITVPALNYGHNLHAMLEAITPRTRVIFIANPNNPTGTFVSAAELSRFVEQVPENVLLVLDEAYIEFLANAPDFLPLLRSDRKPNLLLMRTFSKIYGLAGLRVGYGIGTREFISALEKVRQPFNLNTLAQAAALAALEDLEHVRKTADNNALGLKYYSEAFRKLALQFIPSAANFILVHVGNGQQVFQQMQQQGIIVRPMGGYQLPDWIRISIGTPAQNERCIEALKKCLRR
jgi:histidinol-phosphate aminotransferase